MYNYTQSGRCVIRLDDGQDTVVQVPISKISRSSGSLWGIMHEGMHYNLHQEAFMLDEFSITAQQYEWDGCLDHIGDPDYGHYVKTDTKEFLLYATEDEANDGQILPELQEQLYRAGRQIRYDFRPQPLEDCRYSEGFVFPPLKPRQQPIRIVRVKDEFVHLDWECLPV